MSQQLKKKLPGLRGFSERNIKNMRTFYEEWKCLENAMQIRQFQLPK
ncbi:MAG: hypothetical protein IJ933_05570 [Bacteroidales bacterium]|nr:hypothetical protein [Bacteroidales bacterium]